MPYKERETEKVYFNIAEVAEMIHQETSLVRFWETEFNELHPKRNKKGNRHYTRADIQTVLDINILVKGMGMTLDGVKDAYAFAYVEDIKELYANKRRTPGNNLSLKFAEAINQFVEDESFPYYGDCEGIGV